MLLSSNHNIPLLSGHLPFMDKFQSNYRFPKRIKTLIKLSHIISGHLDGARMLILAGYDLRQETYLWTNKNIPEVLVLNPEFWEWIQEFISSPPPLRQLVRRLFRRILGCPLNKKLEKLTILPQFLRNYILMLELESDL